MISINVHDTTNNHNHHHRNNHNNINIHIVKKLIHNLYSIPPSSPWTAQKPPRRQWAIAARAASPHGPGPHAATVAHRGSGSPSLGAATEAHHIALDVRRTTHMEKHFCRRQMLRSELCVCRLFSLIFGLKARLLSPPSTARIAIEISIVVCIHMYIHTPQ